MSNPIGRNKDIKKLEMTFELPAEAPRIFSIVSDELQWPSELEPRVLKSHPNDRVLVALADFTRLEVLIKTNLGRCEVILTQDLIKTSEEVSKYRELWNDWFQQISNRVDP
ncbi:MAG: hypothetical protein RIS26_266 [Actinomycetota bacterium]|jgi:hypothetical protein